MPTSPRVRPHAAIPSLLLALALGCGRAHPAAPVYSDGSALVDQSGRHVVLRGVNIRAAGFFDAYRGHLPLPPFAADDCRILGEQLGMSSLRLPVSWSLLEPSRGSFDDGYIDSVLQLAAACAQYDVLTFVDLHQDAWSKYVGADGAPLWAHDPPLPDSAADQSEGNQAPTSDAVQAAFAGFFADHGGLMTEYAAMAAHLARRLDRQPGIIGLELMNEPLGTPAELAAFYGLVAPRVRAAAPDLPIYFEPNATRNVVDFANPDPLTVADVVYAPHLYTGVFQGNWKIGQDARIDSSIGNMLSEALGVHAPLMVTELGADPADAIGAAWLTAALGLLDQHALSASLWVYEEWPSTCGHPSCWGLYDETPVVDGSGQTTYARTLRGEAVTLLARGYPRAISGRLDSFAWDAAGRTLTVQLQGAAGTHVLAAPLLVYPGDVAVSCDGRSVPATRQGSRVSVACGGGALVMSPAAP